MMESKRLDKKGQLVNNLNMLVTGGIIMTVFIITMAIGSDILNDIRIDGTSFNATTGNVENASFVYNVSQNGLTGLGNLSAQSGLIGTVIALTVVLLILVTLLFRQFSGTRI